MDTGSGFSPRSGGDDGGCAARSRPCACRRSAPGHRWRVDPPDLGLEAGDERVEEGCEALGTGRVAGASVLPIAGRADGLGRRGTHRGRRDTPASTCFGGPTCLRVSPASPRADRTRPRHPPVQRCKTTRADGLAFRTRRGDPSPVVTATPALCGSRIVHRGWCRPSPTWPRVVSVFADKSAPFGSPIADFTCRLMSSMNDRIAADVVDRRQACGANAMRKTRRAIADRVDRSCSSASATRWRTPDRGQAVPGVGPGMPAPRRTEGCTLGPTRTGARGPSARRTSGPGNPRSATGDRPARSGTGAAPRANARRRALPGSLPPPR